MMKFNEQRLPDVRRKLLELINSSVIDGKNNTTASIADLHNIAAFIFSTLKNSTDEGYLDDNDNPISSKEWKEKLIKIVYDNVHDKNQLISNIDAAEHKDNIVKDVFFESATSNKYSKMLSLREADFYVGGNGQLTSDTGKVEGRDLDVPEFVKKFFGYEPEPEPSAQGKTIEYNNEPPAKCACTDDTTNCTCAEPDCEQSNTDSKDGWLSLNNLTDNAPLGKACELISSNFNKNAHSSSSSNQETILTVDGVTDNDEIKEIVNVIRGTLEDGGYCVNAYRLNKGNLELLITC